MSRTQRATLLVLCLTLALPAAPALAAPLPESGFFDLLLARVPVLSRVLEWVGPEVGWTSPPQKAGFDLDGAG